MRLQSIEPEGSVGGLIDGSGGLIGAITPPGVNGAYFESGQIVFTVDGVPLEPLNLLDLIAVDNGDGTVTLTMDAYFADVVDTGLGFITVSAASNDFDGGSP